MTTILDATEKPSGKDLNQNMETDSAFTPSTIERLHEIRFKRQRCQYCGSKAVFFCPKCFKALSPDEENLIPKIHLPTKVLVLRRDKPRRNTAAQVKTLAYNSTTIHDLPLTSKKERKARCFPKVEIQEFENVDKGTEVVLLYPSEKAVTFEEMTPDELKKLKYIVVIDCPWRRTKAILDLPALSGIKHVKLKNIPERGRFWRVPPEGGGYLSTVEAVHYAFREMAACYNNASNSDAKGHTLGCEAESLSEQADKLLFFFDKMEMIVNEKRKSIMGNLFVPIADEKYRKEQRKKWYPAGFQGNDDVEGPLNDVKKAKC